MPDKEKTWIPASEMLKMKMKQDKRSIFSIDEPNDNGAGSQDDLYGNTDANSRSSTTRGHIMVAVTAIIGKTVCEVEEEKVVANTV